VPTRGRASTPVTVRQPIKTGLLEPRSLPPGAVDTHVRVFDPARLYGFTGPATDSTTQQTS
jgi:hypothetical protein